MVQKNLFIKTICSQPISIKSLPTLLDPAQQKTQIINFNIISLLGFAQTILKNKGVPIEFGLV